MEGLGQETPTYNYLTKLKTLSRFISQMKIQVTVSLQEGVFENVGFVKCQNMKAS